MNKKTILYIVLICILTIGIFTLSGCKNNEQDSNTTDNTVNNTTGESLRNQIMNAQNNVGESGEATATTTTKLEDLEKYNKVEDSNYKTYKYSEGVSFMYPQNWISVGTEEEPAYMSPDGKGATVNIIKDVMSADTTGVTDFDSYIGFQKLYLMQQMTMLSDIAEKQVNLNGKKAYILNYVAETEESSTTMQLNVTQAAFVDEENNVYILTFAVINKYYDDFQDTFDKMIKSFIKE